MTARHARRSGRPRRRWLPVVAVAALAACFVSAAPAVPASMSVPVNQAFPVPASGVYVLDGHGFGHGIGLSQWGAYYGAAHGQSYQQILAHYYPGAALGSDGSPRAIRVRIEEAASNQLLVNADSTLTVTDSATRKNLAAQCVAAATLPSVTRWAVAVNQGSPPTQMLFAYSSAYRNGYLHCPGSFTGPIVFADSAGHPVTEVLPGNVTRAFDGTLGATTLGLASLAAVNAVPLEQYVAGVVPFESPASWPLAALEAQAVAARTYALRSYAGGAWDICDNQNCQVYGGVPSEADANSTAATADTAGQALYYGGAPILAMYSASNGGYSVDGGEPYLPAQADAWDAASPEHNWSVHVSASSIAAAYPSVGTLRTMTVTVRDGSGQWQGRVLQVRLDGTAGSLTVGGSALSAALGLMSNWWNVDPSSYPPPAPTEALQPGYPVGAAWTSGGPLVLVGRDGSGGVAAVGWTASGGWSAAVSLGGRIIGYPQAATGPTGGVIALGEGTNTAAYVRRVSGGPWYGLGGRLTSPVTGLTWAPGRFAIFARGTDGALWVRASGTRWGPWISLGGVLAAGTTAAAVSPAPGRITVLVSGSNHQLWQRQSGPGGWAPWHKMGLSVAGQPTAASPGPSQVMALDRQSGSVLASFGTEGSLGPWTTIGTGFSTDPVATAAPAGSPTRVDAFAWSGTTLQRATWTGSWSAWGPAF